MYNHHKLCDHISVLFEIIAIAVRFFGEDSLKDIFSFLPLEFSLSIVCLYCEITSHSCSHMSLITSPCFSGCRGCNLLCAHLYTCMYFIINLMTLLEGGYEVKQRGWCCLKTTYFPKLNHLLLFSINVAIPFVSWIICHTHTHTQ